MMLPLQLGSKLHQSINLFIKFFSVGNIPARLIIVLSFRSTVEFKQFLSEIQISEHRLMRRMLERATRMFHLLKISLQHQQRL